MAVTQATTGSPQFEVESVLSACHTYRETLTIRRIAAQPWLTELVITTQLSTARHPQEKRVKARCCAERAQLLSQASALQQFLEATASPGETARH